MQRQFIVQTSCKVVRRFGCYTVMCCIPDDREVIWHSRCTFCHFCFTPLFYTFNTQTAARYQFSLEQQKNTHRMRPSMNERYICIMHLKCLLNCVLILKERHTSSFSPFFLCCCLHNETLKKLSFRFICQYFIARVNSVFKAKA